jgi:hypothetical protein
MQKKYRKRKYVIFDNIFYTDYIYDIYYLYYYKKFSSKCYLINK